MPSLYLASASPRRRELLTQIGVPLSVLATAIDESPGGYAIQGLGAIFVSRIEGSYSAVVGLPLCETAELLREFGIPCWQPVGGNPP